MMAWGLLLLLAFQGDTLTYEAAVRWFQQENPDLRIGQIQRGMAHLSWWRALTQLLPTPALSASYSSQTRPYPLWPTPIGQPEEAYSVEFSLEQVLFSPQVWSQALDQRLKAIQADWTYRDLRNTMWASFRRAYFEAYLAQEEVRLRTLAVKRAREALALVQKKVELGQAVRLDLLQAQLAVQQAVRDSIAAVQTLSSRKQALASLLGRPRASFSVLLPPKTLPDSAGIESLIQRATVLLEQHPAIQKQKVEVQASRIAFWATVLSWLPTVRYGVYWSYYEPDFPTWRRFQDQSREVRGVYVNLSLSFFTYPLDAVLSQKNRRLQVELLKKARLQQRVTLQQALSTFETARKSLGIAELSMETAREAFQLAKAQYAVGALSTLDLLKAQEQFTQAEVQALQAKVQWWIALDQLKLAIGEAFPW